VRVHRERADVGEHQRVAVGRRFRRIVDRDVAAGPGAVLHHHLLAEEIAHRLLQDARRRVGAAAGLEPDDDGHRLVRVVPLGDRAQGDTHAENCC
jgi:hypothetical protein